MEFNIPVSVSFEVHIVPAASPTAAAHTPEETNDHTTVSDVAVLTVEASSTRSTGIGTGPDISPWCLNKSILVRLYNSYL